QPPSTTIVTPPNHHLLRSPPPVDLSSLTANHIDLIISSFFVSLDLFSFPIIPDLVIVSEVTHFAGVFSSVYILMDVVFGRQVHCVGVKVRRFRDVFVGISLLNVYCKCGEMWDARKVFDEIPERNSFTWATLISGYTMGRVCGGCLEMSIRSSISVKGNVLKLIRGLEESFDGEAFISISSKDHNCEWLCINEKGEHIERIYIEDCPDPAETEARNLQHPSDFQRGDVTNIEVNSKHV
nr:hypothetical protein [Tanacetum cinerariifolium]